VDGTNRALAERIGETKLRRLREILEELSG
jgi:hypothetical protein